MSAWLGKPCPGCDGKKGPKFASRKFCGNCARRVRAVNREVQHRARIARVYGIEREAYDRLYSAQDGLCALCRRANGRTKRLAVDHDHLTGVVRGLLCGPCNQVLGHARDDVGFFRRGVAYLTSPPAWDVLGVPPRPVDASTDL